MWLDQQDVIQIQMVSVKCCSADFNIINIIWLLQYRNCSNFFINSSLEKALFVRYNNREEFDEVEHDMDVTLKTTAILSTNQASKLSADNQPRGSATAKLAKNYDYPKQADASPPSRDDAEQVTDRMNKLMELMNTDLQFSLHEKTKRLIVQMVDKRDGTVLKEFPPHELLDTIANIQEYVGMLLDKKA